LFVEIIENQKFTDMVSFIIALLLNFGVISCPDEYHNASDHQKEIYTEICEDIIGEDIDGI
jgi:hypothetical protein